MPSSSIWPGSAATLVVTNPHGVVATMGPRLDLDFDDRPEESFRAGQAAPFLDLTNPNHNHPVAASMAPVLGAMPSTAWGAFLRAGDLVQYLDWSTAGTNGIQVDLTVRRLYIPGADLSPQALARSVYFTHQFQFDLLRGHRLASQMSAQQPPPYLQPDQALWAARLAAADQIVAAIACAHEMRADLPGLWRHVLAGDVGDLAAIYAEHHETKGEKAALNAAILAWYQDLSRVSACDRAALDHLDATFADNKARILCRARLTKAMAQNLCVGPDEKSYLTASTAEALQTGAAQSITDPITAQHLAQIRREQDVIMICNIGFRDPGLARAIFPDHRP